MRFEDILDVAEKAYSDSAAGLLSLRPSWDEKIEEPTHTADDVLGHCIVVELHSEFYGYPYDNDPEPGDVLGEAAKLQAAARRLRAAMSHIKAVVAALEHEAKVRKLFSPQKLRKRRAVKP